MRDTHFYFEGPIITQLNEAFAEDWLFVSGELLTGDAWFPTLEKAGDATARVITSGPDQDLDKIELIILQAIACARRSIKIMSPYFLSDDRLTTALSLAAMRGVEVDIILPEKNNHVLVGWAMGAQIVPLVASGCRIWRNQPPFEHSKVMTVDGAWCLLGSANWDMRSFRLNFELNVEVYHNHIARDADDFMASKQTHRVTAEEISRRALALRLRGQWCAPAAPLSLAHAAKKEREGSVLKPSHCRPWLSRCRPASRRNCACPAAAHRVNEGGLPRSGRPERRSVRSMEWDWKKQTYSLAHGIGSLNRIFWKFGAQYFLQRRASALADPGIYRLLPLSVRAGLNDVRVLPTSTSLGIDRQVCPTGKCPGEPELSIASKGSLNCDRNSGGETFREKAMLRMISAVALVASLFAFAPAKAQQVYKIGVDQDSMQFSSVDPKSKELTGATPEIVQGGRQGCRHPGSNRADGLWRSRRWSRVEFHRCRGCQFRCDAQPSEEGRYQRCILSIP